MELLLGCRVRSVDSFVQVTAHLLCYHLLKVPLSTDLGSHLDHITSCCTRISVYLRLFLRLPLCSSHLPA